LIGLGFPWLGKVIQYKIDAFSDFDTGIYFILESYQKNATKKQHAAKKKLTNSNIFAKLNSLICSMILFQFSSIFKSGFRKDSSETNSITTTGNTQIKSWKNCIQSAVLLY
jgi:hypothetical protein